LSAKTAKHSFLTSSLIGIFHVHRSLIWLASWVSQASLSVMVFVHVARSSPPLRTQKHTPHVCVVQLFFLVNVRKTPFYSGHSHTFDKPKLLLVPPLPSFSLFGSALCYHLHCIAGGAPLFVQTPQGLGSVFLRKEGERA
jgi:hypothetical protein